MHRHVVLALPIACLFLIAVTGRSQDQPNAQAEKSNVQVLMRDKLTHMQKVLDGLVTDNFETVIEEANMLRMIGRAASWQAIDSEEYRTHSRRYALLTSNLSKAAKNKNRDAVLLQYLQLNISCVGCHQYIREQKSAQNPELDLFDDK